MFVYEEFMCDLILLNIIFLMLKGPPHAHLFPFLSMYIPHFFFIAPLAFHVVWVWVRGSR